MNNTTETETIVVLSAAPDHDVSLILLKVSGKDLLTVCELIGLIKILKIFIKISILSFLRNDFLKEISHNKN